MRIKNIKDTIREHFFNKPSSKLRVREIERLLNVPLPSVIRYCKELEKEGILSLIKIGSVSFYTANKADKNYIFEKKYYNLKMIYDDGLVDHLRHELSNPVIILFGSFAKGEDIEESDIDLYIETPSNKKINLDKFEKKFGRKIQIFQFKNIKEVSNPHLANNIINGMLLNGFLEVFK